MTADDAAAPAYVLLANAAASRAESPAVETAAEVLRADGATVTVVHTRHAADVDDVLATLDGRRLVVCGGDGSLHLLLTRAHAAGVADALDVGLVPLGTGNDLARGLGIPHDDPAAAAAHLRAGQPRRLDLLVGDHGQICVNALHLGIGATAAARATALKSALHELAYPVGALLAGLTEEGTRTRVEVDGQVVCDDETLLVAVCNGPGFGGGTVVAPDADPTDGQLDVVVVRATGPVERAAFGLALQRGTHLERDDVHHVRGTRVAVSGTGLRANVDGEVGGPGDEPLTWRVLPHAWQLRV